MFYPSAVNRKLEVGGWKLEVICAPNPKALKSAQGTPLEGMSFFSFIEHSLVGKHFLIQTKISLYRQTLFNITFFYVKMRLSLLRCNFRN